MRKAAWYLLMVILLATTATAGWFIWQHYKGEQQARRESAEAERALANAREDALAPIDVTPAELENAFAENEVAAIDKYIGKVVRMRGVVDAVTIEKVRDKDVLILVLQSRLQVPCVFTDTPDTRRQLASLTKGQRVTVRGVCRRGVDSFARRPLVVRCALEGP